MPNLTQQLDKPDIFEYGFSKLLNREIRRTESPLVYNMVEERLSKLVQSGETLVGLIPGLTEKEI